MSRNPSGVTQAQRTQDFQPSRRLDIQGLRAIAVLMVVAFHAGLPVPGGFVGVDMFFVISGFVITGMLHRTWASTGRIAFKEFYWRRFKRLTPALALTISVTVLVSAALLSPLGPQQNAAATGIGAMLLVSNFVIAHRTGGYFDAPAETNPLLNTWSLSVEEQFYLAFPALLALGWHLAWRRGWFRFSPHLIVGAIVVISFGLAVVSANGITFPGSSWILGFYSPFTRAWEFAAGALLSLAMSRWAPQQNRVMPVLGLTGIAMLGASLWMISNATPFPGPWTLLPVTGTLLLLIAGSQMNSAALRFLSSAPLVKIGDWSYSIYLWHWPLIVFAAILWPHNDLSIVAAAVVSLIPALLSYRYVEQPIRNMQEVGIHRATVIISATVAVPLTLSLAVGVVARLHWSPYVEAFVSNTTQTAAGYALGCHSRAGDGYADPVPCEWSPDSTGKPMYLLGDSNAAHYTEALIETSSALERPLIVTTSSGCPLLDLSFISPGNPGYEDACSARTERLLTWMATQSPGVVVLSHSDTYFLDEGWKIRNNNIEAVDDDEKIQLMQRSLESTIKRLQSNGHEVVMIQTIPHFFDRFTWNPAECTLFAILTSNCTFSMPLAMAEQRSAPVRQAIEEVAANTKVKVVDLADNICLAGVCSSHLDGQPVYRDANHISTARSRSLASTFTELIRPL